MPPDRAHPGRARVQIVWAEPHGDAADRALLTAGELDRAGRLLVPAERDRFVTSRALLRREAGAALGLDPGAVAIGQRCARCGGPHGRPELTDDPGLHASVAHAADRCVVALTRAGPVGVDVERADAVRFAGFDDVALGPRERDEIAALGPGDRPVARATVWVRKEAVLKLLGLGLTGDPTDLHVGTADRPRWLRRRAALPPMLLGPVDLGGDHVAAVAVLTGDAVAIGVRRAAGPSRTATA